jgi:hypothetical protein
MAGSMVNISQRNPASALPPDRYARVRGIGA